MNKIVAIIDLKGGSGKTILGVHLSAGLAIRGKKVLLIDNNPIGTEIRGLIPENVKLTYDMESVYEGISLKNAIYQSTIKDVDIVPFLDKDIDFFLNLPGLRFKQFNETDKNPLKKAFKSKVIKDYDYIVIDNFRLLDPMIVNLLQVVDKIIVPINDWSTMKKLENANDIILKITGIKFELCIDAIIMTKVVSNTVIFKKIKEQLVEVFGDKVCRTVIPETIKFSEALHHNKSVYDYDPKSYAAIQCMKLVDELLQKWEQEATLFRKENSKESTRLVGTISKVYSTAESPNRKREEKIVRIGATIWENDMRRIDTVMRILDTKNKSKAVRFMIEGCWEVHGKEIENQLKKISKE